MTTTLWIGCLFSSILVFFDCDTSTSEYKLKSADEKQIIEVLVSFTTQHHRRSGCYSGHVT